MKAKKLGAVVLAACLLGGVGVVSADSWSDLGTYLKEEKTWMPEKLTGDSIAIAAADLDRDGTTELLVAEFNASDFATETKIYRPQGKDIEGVKVIPIKEDDGKNALKIDMTQTTLHAYKNPSDGTIWYVGIDLGKAYTNLFAFSLQGDEIFQRRPARYESRRDEGLPPVFYNEIGEVITESEYGEVEDKVFGEWEKLPAKLSWIVLTPTDLENWNAMTPDQKRVRLFGSAEEFAHAKL